MWGPCVQRRFGGFSNIELGLPVIGYKTTARDVLSTMIGRWDYELLMSFLKEIYFVVFIEMIQYNAAVIKSFSGKC